MSLKDTVKRNLPVSSATLDALGADVREMREQMLTAAEARQIHDELHWDVSAQLLGEVRALRNELKSHDEKMVMFAWEGYRRDGEALDDAKKRFFRSLPTATGGMRLFQLGCTKLLSEFDALCEEHSLQYWMVFGTLLGAVRHEGFIPWDDDVDLAMPRDEINRLVDVVEGDDRYVVMVVYDAYAHCKQVRFRYADQSIPCFLDLFIVDWAPSAKDASASGMRALRDEMVEKMDTDASLEFWREEEPCLTEDDTRAGMVAGYFDAALEKARKEGLVCDRDHAKAIVWSPDNMTSIQKRQTYALEDVLPAVDLPFEKTQLKAPANYDLLLRSPYGDYLELPNDIKGRFEHVSHDEVELGSTYDALASLVK